METIPFRKQHKLPKLFSSEEVMFNVMVCTDGRHWLYGNSFDSLEEAKEYAARRMNDDWIQKTVIVKETTTQRRDVLKDTLNEKQ